jgi:hypothetical protein
MTPSFRFGALRADPGSSRRTRLPSRELPSVHTAECSDVRSIREDFHKEFARRMKK